MRCQRLTPRPSFRAYAGEGVLHAKNLSSLIKFFRAVRKVSFLFILILLFTGSPLPAQKEGAIWYFGQNAGLDFNDYSPVPLTNGKIDTREGVATICDKDGKLLFYTDGQTVFNRYHQIMANGEGLFGNISSTQSSIIVPKPGQTVQTQYYIFTVDKVEDNGVPGKGLNYSMVDLLINPPGGRVTQKNIPLVANPAYPYTEKITAVKHANGESYWIIAHGFNNWAFQVFLLDRNGLHSPDEYLQGAQHRNMDPNDYNNRGATGYLKSSPKGDLLAAAIESRQFFQLFSFNNNTGAIKYLITLPAGSKDKPLEPSLAAYGVEFSPTGNYFYGSTRQGGVIYQWDISDILDDTKRDTTAIKESVYIIREDKYRLTGALQLGFNGKIYVALSGQQYLGVIHSPIQGREKCNYKELGASLYSNETGTGGKSYFGLPTFLPDFFKAAEFYYENTCQNDTTLFYLSTMLVVGRPAWTVYDEIGSILVGKADVDESMQGKFRFPSPGNYLVELRVQQYGYPEPTVQRRPITIHPLPELDLPDRTSLCKGSPAVLDAGYGAFYSWRDNPNINLERYHTVYNPGHYYVTVTHYNGCVNTDSTEVVEMPLPLIKDTIVTKAACGYNNGSIELVMETDTSDYLFEWEQDSTIHTGKINGLGGGVYKVKITSEITGCSINSSFIVSEDNAPEVNISSSASRPVCPGTPVTLTATGAVNWLWENPAGITTDKITVTPLVTTTYIVKGYSLDYQGKECSAYDDITVEVFTVYPPELGLGKVGCEGDTITLDGGDYSTWAWSNGETNRKVYITEDIDPLVLTVIDKNGCVSSDNITIRIKPLPVVDLGVDRKVCKGTEVILDGGEGDSWLWNTGETTQTLNILETGTYQVTTTKEGCSADDLITITINNPDNLKINKVQLKDISCNGYADGSIQIVAHGDGSMYEYSIDNGATYYDNQGLFENLDGSTPYYIRVKEDGVCDVKSDTVYEIHEPDPISADFKLVSPSCEQCEDGEITLAIAGGTPPYEVLWSTLDSALRLRNVGMGTYTVWITDSLRCPAKSSIEMEMGHGAYSIPNAFTPNGDKVNDFWEIAALKDKPNNLILVYTLAGRKVFESSEDVPFWDGNDMNTGDPLPVGSYFYMIYIDKSAKAKPLTGTVTVLR